MNNEIDKILDRPSFFRWKPAAVLRVSGEDAATFLQGQFTNDLRAADRRDATYGLWLNHKGKVLADSFVVARSSGEFWVWSYSSPGAEIRARLETYIVADDVQIDDQTDRWAGRAVFETENSRPISPPASVSHCFVGRRALRPNVEWLYVASPENEFAVDGSLAGCRELTLTEMEILRIAATIPGVPIDLGIGELPNEGGLEEAAISYTKGCYLGQEVMARLRTMGQVRRRLHRVRSTNVGVPTSFPVGLFDGERRIGELRSAVSVGTGFIGLALLNLLNFKPSTPLSLSPGDGRALVEIFE